MNYLDENGDCVLCTRVIENGICKDNCEISINTEINGYCIPCQENYVLYNEECLSECPDGLYLLKINLQLSCLNECPSEYFSIGKECIHQSNLTEDQLLLEAK